MLGRVNILERRPTASQYALTKAEDIMALVQDMKKDAKKRSGKTAARTPTRDMPQLWEARTLETQLSSHSSSRTEEASKEASNPQARMTKQDKWRSSPTQPTHIQAPHGVETQTTRPRSVTNQDRERKSVDG